MSDGVTLFSTIISWFLDSWLPVFLLIGTWLFLFWRWKTGRLWRAK